MKKNKKETRQIAVAQKLDKKTKSQHKDSDFLTEVLACMAWTTKA